MAATQSILKNGGRKAATADNDSLRAVLMRHICAPNWMPSQSFASQEHMEKLAGMWRELRGISENFSFKKTDCLDIVRDCFKSDWPLGGGTIEEWTDKMVKRFREVCAKLGGETRRTKKAEWFDEMFATPVTPASADLFEATPPASAETTPDNPTTAETWL